MPLSCARQHGLLASCEKVAGVIGPLAAGPLYSHAGAAAPACASALVALLGGGATLLFASRLRALTLADRIRINSKNKVSSHDGIIMKKRA